MISRGPLAAVVVASLVLVTPVRAEERACNLGTPAPTGSERLRWRATDADEGAPGFWVSDAAMQRAAQRRQACLDLLTKCETDKAAAQAKAWRPGLKAWIIGVTIAFGAGVATAKAIK